MHEMAKLTVLLATNGIPFEFLALNIGGEPAVLIVSPSQADCKIDATSHHFSYGGDMGLIEIMVEDSAFEEETGDSVMGYLTAEEALPYFQRWSK